MLSCQQYSTMATSKLDSRLEEVRKISMPKCGLQHARARSGPSIPDFFPSARSYTVPHCDAQILYVSTPGRERTSTHNGHPFQHGHLCAKSFAVETCLPF